MTVARSDMTADIMTSFAVTAMATHSMTAGASTRFRIDTQKQH